MVHVMPAKPAVVPGAAVVDFPWHAAAAAVAALDGAAAELGTQYDGHQDLRMTISDWEGAFRDEHDDKYYSLTTTLWGLIGTLSFRAGAIVTAAEEAASQQIRNNQAAEREWFPRPSAPAQPG